MEKRLCCGLSLILALASCGARQDRYEITYFDRGYRMEVCESYVSDGDSYEFSGRCVPKCMVHSIKIVSE